MYALQCRLFNFGVYTVRGEQQGNRCRTVEVCLVNIFYDVRRETRLIINQNQKVHYEVPSEVHKPLK